MAPEKYEQESVVRKGSRDSIDKHDKSVPSTTASPLLLIKRVLIHSSMWGNVGT